MVKVGENGMTLNQVTKNSLTFIWLLLLLIFPIFVVINKTILIMETGTEEVKLKDGRTFRVHVNNSAQSKRLYKAIRQIENKIESHHTVVNGVHTIKQFELILKTI